MIRLIFFTIKTTLYSALILVLGHLIQWNGLTLSNHVENQMYNAESGKFIRKFKRWSNQFIHQWETSKNKTNKKTTKSQEAHSDSITTSQSNHESISKSERQKLRSLIQDINKD